MKDGQIIEVLDKNRDPSGRSCEIPNVNRCAMGNLFETEDLYEKIRLK